MTSNELHGYKWPKSKPNKNCTPSHEAQRLYYTDGEQVTIRVDEVNVIKETVSERILGIQVSNNLGWKDQLAHLHSALLQRVSLFCRVCRRLPSVNLLPVLDGIATSIIRYCLPLFAKPRTSEEDTMKKEWKALQVVYNKAVRALLHVSLKDHKRTTELFEEAGLLSINQLACQSIITLVWKTLAGKCKGAQGLFNRKTTNTQAHTRSQETVWLEVKNRSKLTIQSLPSIGAELWNMCPREIKDSPQVVKLELKETIKRFVKTLPF